MDLIKEINIAYLEYEGKQIIASLSDQRTLLLQQQ